MFSFPKSINNITDYISVSDLGKHHKSFINNSFTYLLTHSLSDSVWRPPSGSGQKEKKKSASLREGRDYTGTFDSDLRSAEGEVGQGSFVCDPRIRRWPHSKHQRWRVRVWEWECVWDEKSRVYGWERRTGECDWSESIFERGSPVGSSELRYAPWPSFKVAYTWSKSTRTSRWPLPIRDETPNDYKSREENLRGPVINNRVVGSPLG